MAKTQNTEYVLLGDNTIPYIP